MISNYSLKLVHQHHGSLAAISIRLFAAVVFLGIFGVSPAFGDNTYSDSWGDESGTIRACGITEGVYTHLYYVNTTLTSPNGRTDQGQGMEQIQNARTDVSLPLLMDDIGDYNTTSTHSRACPDVPGFFYVIGITAASVATGTSRAIYKLDFCTVSTPSPLTYYCEFVPIPGCTVSCMASLIVRRPSSPPGASDRIIRLQSWVQVGSTRVCVPGLVDEVDSPFGTTLPCAELP